VSTTPKRKRKSIIERIGSSMEHEHNIENKTGSFIEHNNNNNFKKKKSTSTSNSLTKQIFKPSLLSH
jgi:hypothetical protein